MTRRTTGRQSRIGKCLAVGLVAASLGGMALGAGRWLKSSTGLDGGRVIVVAINPVDPATIYAGTSGASLFRSRDGGGHWSPVRQGLPRVRASVNS